MRLSLQKQISLLEVGRVKLDFVIEVIISKVHEVIFQRDIVIIFPTHLLLSNIEGSIALVWLVDFNQRYIHLSLLLLCQLGIIRQAPGLGCGAHLISAADLELILGSSTDFKTKVSIRQINGLHKLHLEVLTYNSIVNLRLLLFFWLA